MGMYTELVLKCEINKSKTNKMVEDVLQYLFNGGGKPTELPTHKFFECERWHFIGRGSSYYHVPFNCSVYDEGYIFSRSDLKDYNNEIHYFIEWITPYLCLYGRTCIGWEWYEEMEEPTLIFVGDDDHA